MSDQNIANALPVPPSLQDIVRRKYQQGYTGDDLWQAIMDSAQTPNPNINRIFGID